MVICLPLNILDLKGLLVKRTFLQLFLLLLIIVLLSACSGTAAQPVVPTQANAGDANPAPAEGFAGGEGYPAPAQGLTGEENYPAPMSSNSKIYGPDELPAADTTAPQPQSGMGSLSGTVFSFNSRVVVPDTVFYLARAVDESKVPAILAGPEDAKGDITGRTDAEGKFALDNVPPGGYYLVVWSPYSWSIGVDASQDPPLERLITVEAGQSQALGVVEFSWP